MAALAGKKAGMTRTEIVSAAGRGIAGSLTDILETLEWSGFIRRYRAMGRTKRDGIYQLIDNFTVHLTMVTPFGILRNSHSGRVQSEITLGDLFAP